MWTPQNLLFIFCIALSQVTRASAVIQVSGYEGREAQVSCPYGVSYDTNEKYLCRNDCDNADVLITTTEAEKNRYSIYDDKEKRVFTANISDLSVKDAGKYQCGVTRTGRDIYTEVKLDVVADSCCNQSTKVQSYEEGSASITCQYESKYQNNLKYICRGKQPSICLQQAAITSDNERNGQFRLTDDTVSRKFTVTITGVTQKDSGSYLCGVHRNTSLDVFSAVELEVKEWCCVKSEKLSGIVGRPVTMQCPYPPQHWDNRKFLCKGDHRNNCTDMATSQSRFSLQDDVSSSTFWATITELKAGDAATYWCGSDSQWSVGNYTKTQLSVGLAPIHTVVYILPATLAALVILTVALVMVFKHKCCKVQGAEVSMHRNTVVTAEAGGMKFVDHDDEDQDVSAAGIYCNQNVIKYNRDKTI